MLEDTLATQSSMGRQEVKKQLQAGLGYMRLPAAAKAVRRRDRAGIGAVDPGPERVIKEGAGWLCRAQDMNALGDGGVARDFSLINGWASSYPETTGYIVPTMIDCASFCNDSQYLARAEKMLDWLASIQFEDGGFQGGKIDATPLVPVTFNTGQILIGLAAGVKAFGRYQQETVKAANWLAESLDDDGCWRKFPTPFAAPGEKAYETHVSWGLFEAARVCPDRGFGEAGMRQVRWALTKQMENGWFQSCCLTLPDQPLTHTLGYVLRGLVEAYHWSEDQQVLAAALLTARGLQTALDDEGFMPGRLRSDWSGSVPWACLTGIVQIAHCWLLLYRITGDRSLRDAGLLANSYVRRTMEVQGDQDTRGAVKGSFPVDGGYGSYEYLNWAVKFCVDSNLCELEILASEPAS